jgi:electron transport complex protein RnfA
LLQSLAFGAGAGAGYGLVLLLFAALRDRLETADVPAAFRGAPIALVTAGLLALAFVGFARLDAP